MAARQLISAPEQVLVGDPEASIEPNKGPIDESQDLEHCMNRQDLMGNFPCSTTAAIWLLRHQQSIKDNLGKIIPDKVGTRYIDCKGIDPSRENDSFVSLESDDVSCYEGVRFLGIIAFATAIPQGDDSCCESETLLCQLRSGWYEYGR
jgi:hypothetical protein